MIQSILIVKLAAIGDVVMALPMIKVLKERNPEIKITWLCGRTVRPLLQKIDGIDKIIAINDTVLLSGNIFKRIQILFNIWFKLLFRQLDTVVTGHSSWQYRLLSLTVRTKNRRSFFRNSKGTMPIPGRHHSDEYVRLTTRDDGPILSKAISPTVSWPLSGSIENKINKNTDKKFIALAPGGAKNALHEDAIRRWPLVGYVSLAKRLIENGYNVILTGAPSDRWVCSAFDKLKKSFAGDFSIIDLIGETSLVDLVALYQACDVVVTHDSGPLHLAGLAGTPQVALFGPTNPYEKVPRTDKTKIIWGGENLACRPCYDGKTYAKCHDCVCLKSIKVEEVCDAVLSVLGEHSDIGIRSTHDRLMAKGASRQTVNI
jgi:heptosyltransferase-2